ncbi:nuclear transport factor 2 family protein [Chitinasiproducens palmae]|uniref:SnoaL-like domain-containing protein n=1 Tax=Chitinasiproducens palmae TaxID=1770053 RepID=A0A1H2PWB3_9BURK|nr:nuclear transport factor 2 family protein [Chitinasiproducens palmae]SDV51636.1 conserved hypothetical protein [Chitinasiproducens palmae]
MPRFARLFEAAAETLNAYYAALAERNIEALMELWVDEDFVSCICEDGRHLHGLERIRAGFAKQIDEQPSTIEPLDIRVYDSLATVVYAVAEAHRSDAGEKMVFTTYVMVQDRGEWRIAHLHASEMRDEAAGEFTDKLRKGRGVLH